jgi:class 3 adenylate cyclase
MEKLGQANFVPIIGASGSGKSSVVRAGLIPQLEKNGWRVLEPIMPGVEPLAELKRALLGLFGRTEVREIYALIETDGLHPVINRLPSSERLLLVIDQFEEVFTVCPKEEERRRFIELLTQVAEIPASRLAIVTTMRADFLEPCLSYGSLTRLIQDEAVYMPPLVGAELEEAIEEPTKLQGYSFEKGLLGEILRDVGQEKECLPLLQFALMELWEKRDRTKHQLTVDQYRDLGGVNGALNRHADKIYTYNDFLKEFPQQERSPQEEEWIKRIFLKLVRTGEGIKDTRQRQHRANLLAIAKNKSAHEEAIVKVLDELIQGRLLVTGQEEQQTEAWVDLAHEALMDGWKLFAKWRQENRDLRRLRERIDDAYREWSRARQDKNLMMGGLLDQAKERWLELEPDVSPSIEEFYNKSVTHERNTVEQQAQFERAKHRYINPKYAEFLNFDDLQRLRNRTRAKASILFSGIRDYNSISQGLDDEELSSLSHQYHESMREAIFAYRGSISTYRHNEIMAVFGWPLLLEDHAWEAVLSSIKMRQWLEEFNAHRKEKYKVPIKIGIGIDSDLVRVNYGSIQSLDLTVLGEAVGLSQYLEGASEQYGCDIVISGNTFKPCTERIWFRELDWIRVKGKNGRVAIYEVVGLRSDPISPEKQKMIELYHKGRECYVNRKFTSAMGKFGFILEEIDKNDKAAALYLKYCQHYLQEPPPDDWDGAWTIAD